MHKVTLDTNVIVTGYLRLEESSYMILQLIPEHFSWAISPYILDECKHVFSKRKYLQRLEQDKKTINDVLDDIKAKSNLVVPEKILTVVTQDPWDDQIITCAYVSQSNYLISRDKHLLNIKKYESVVILSPLSFLEQWRKPNI